MTPETPSPPPPPPEDIASPPWGRTIKTLVAVTSLLLLALVAWRFSGLIGQIVTAAILAYLLTPIIVLICRRTPIPRGTATVLVYVIFILLFAGALTALGVVVFGQVVNFINSLPNLVNQTINLLRDWLPAPDREIEFGPFSFTISTLDWAAIRTQLLSWVEPILARSGQYAGQLATTTVRVISTILFVWVISIYIALEIPRLRGYVASVADPGGYRRDAERLMNQFSRIWSAYLRGQIFLGVVIGVVVSITLALLQVQNALALGLLSGLLEFIPTLGPVIGAIAATAVALFQPDHVAGLSPVWHAAVVMGAMIVIQQIENNFLVPRIVGDALDLHPLLVLIAVLMGTSLAGILGAVLAAPVLATA